MKKLTLLMLGILLIVGVTAVGIGNFTKDKTSPILSNEGVSSYEISAINCNSVECDPVCINIEGIINRCYNPEPTYKTCKIYNNKSYFCEEYEIKTYTNQELLDRRNKWEQAQISKAEAQVSKIEEAKDEKSSCYRG